MSKLEIPVKGEIRGTAVVRDKDGKIKSSFTFGGPATEEQFNQLRGLGNPKVDVIVEDTLQEKDNGSDTDHGRA